MNDDASMKRRSHAKKWVLFSLGALLLLLACTRPPTQGITSPGAERQRVEREQSRSTHFHLRCPNGAPRLGADCGLLAYWWYSPLHIQSYFRKECHGQTVAECEQAFERSYRAQVTKRYQRAAVSPADIVLGLSERLNVAQPLLYETLILLTHNYMLEHFPESDSLASTGAQRKYSQESEAAALAELTQRFGEQLAQAPLGLPDVFCPQSVFGGVECEGTTWLLGMPWRPSRVIFQLRSPAVSAEPKPTGPG